MKAAGDAYSLQQTRRNARAFLLGRAASALLTLGYVGLLVRLLPIDAYAAYVSLIASLETCLVLATLGLDWVLLRYTPEYVVQGTAVQLRHFIAKVAQVRFGACLVVGLCALALAVVFQPQLIHQHQVELAIVVALMLIEGQLRLMRDSALESLGEQPLSQTGIALRAGIVLGCLGVCLVMGKAVDLRTVLLSELLATLITWVYSVAAVHHVIGRLRGRAAGAEWQAPKQSSVLQFGWNNYISSLVSYPYTLQAMMLLVSFMAAPATIAAFGFVVRLIGIVRGYLPALLLMGVLRPRLLGQFALSGDFKKLAFEALLASRLSAITLLPFVAVMVVYGEPLLAWAAGGKFNEQHWILVTLTIALIPRAHRHISVVLTNCVDQASLLTRTSVILLLPIPFLLSLTAFIPVQWVAVIAVFCDEIGWIVLLTMGLRKVQYDWSGDWNFTMRLVAMAAISSVSVGWLSTDADLVSVLLGASMITFLYALMLAVVRPLSRADLQMVSGFMRSRRAGV